MTDRHPGPAGAWRLGRLAGVDLYVRPGLLVMAVVLVLLFAPRYEGRDVNAHLLAATLVLAIYLSVLLHELAHVVAARRYRMPVHSVTLHLLGGETVIEGQSRTPGQEFWTSVVGPLASAAVGIAAFAVSDVLGDGTTGDLAWSLGFVNVLVAVFNLLPGLPLDGGRVLHALVWALTRRESTGITVAGWLGRIAALAAVAVGIFSFNRGGQTAATDLAVALLVAWFLWQGASDALRQGSRTARIAHLDAGRLAEPDPGTPGLPELPAGLSGANLLRAISLRPAEAYRLVDAEGNTVGILRTERIDQAYREGRA